MNINTQSLQAFLADRGSRTESRLYIKNKELRYADIGCGYRFAAKLGFGNASMSNVAEFIRKNQDTCFANPHDITAYHDFIVSYNDNRSIFCKKAKNIKEVTSFTQNTDFAAVSRDSVHTLVQHHLANCKILSKRNDIQALISHCTLLSESLSQWPLDDAITKEEKRTLNEVIAFKNRARASFFPANANPLKGKAAKPIALDSATEEDKAHLRAVLKEVQAITLKKYFHARLESDQEQLDSLKWRFETNKESFQEIEFLEGQLNKWQKKLDQGKPIAIPKWYHCTHQAGTVEKILDTSILFMKKGAYAGAFVSIRPEIGGYGNYCIMLSDRIEKTGTKEPGKKDTVYPKESNFSGINHISYSDKPIAHTHKYFTNHEWEVSIWLGFQRGKKTLRWSGWGTEGIPIERSDRIKNGNLKYYKDTTAAFIYHEYDDSTLQSVGHQSRVPVLRRDEAEALRKLITATFHVTLPNSWEGNIRPC